MKLKKNELVAADYVNDLLARIESQQATITELKKHVEKIDALKDRLNNGIKYDEKLNVYTVRWTKLELEAAALAANEICEKIHWSEPLPRATLKQEDEK